MYLPKSKYTGPLYTPTGVYVYEDGTSFKGWFIVTYQGEAYEGINPKEIGSKIILKTVYDLRNALPEISIGDLFYLDPKQKDYDKGTITRYFVKVKSNNQIKEVKQLDYNLALGEPTLQRLQITWNLTGPVDDTKIGSYIKEGAASKNKKVVEAAEQEMQGISQYITDYGEFVK